MCVCFRSKAECCSVCRRDGGWSLWGTLHHYSVSHQQVKTPCSGQWYVSEVFLIWQCVCVCVSSPQSAAVSAADAGLCDAGGHTGPEEPQTQRWRPGCRILRALSQLLTGETAGALLQSHIHTDAGAIHTGTGPRTILKTAVLCLKLILNINLADLIQFSNISFKIIYK